MDFTVAAFESELKTLSYVGCWTNQVTLLTESTRESDSRNMCRLKQMALCCLQLKLKIYITLDVGEKKSYISQNEHHYEKADKITQTEVD